MKFNKVKGSPMIVRSDCGRYTIGKVPQPEIGSALYSAWYGFERIPCYPATYHACLGACITHKEGMK